MPSSTHPHQNNTFCFFVILLLVPLWVFAQPPANDNCANAIELAVGVSCVSGNYSNENATAESASIAPKPQCPHYAGSDVWFKVDMPSSGVLRIEAETLNSATPPSVAVYSGACGNFKEVICYVLDRNKTVTDPGLSGQTIYIRIYTYNSSIGKAFSLCVYEPVIPVNDNCENAIALTVGSRCSPITYSNGFASKESALVAPTPGCSHYAGGDVWFKMSMPASGALRIETNNLAGATALSVNIYQGTCGNFTEVSCYELDNGKTLYRNDLIGKTLHIRIFSFNSDEGNAFSLCAYEPVIPSNDNCSDAIAIPVGKNCSMANYSNVFSTPESQVVAPLPGCRNPGTGDVWFKVVMPSTGALRVEARNLTSATPPSVSIYSGTCGSFTEIMCYQQDAAKIIIDKNLAGEILYIRIFTFNTDEGLPFSLCVYEPSVPTNDNCGNAITLTADETCKAELHSNAFATEETFAVAQKPSCGYFAGGDVWFTVNMPVGGSLALELTNLVSAIPPSLTIYSGACGNFTEVACFSQNGNPVVYEPALAGQKLYLRIYTFNSEEGNPFSICVNDAACVPVTNDVSRSACEGTSLQFGALNLTQEGLYSQTFKTLDGCDSLVNLDLRFNSIYQVNDTVAVCSGEEYIFPDGTKKQNIISPYQHISQLQTKQFCDSIITTYVDVTTIDTTVVSDGLTLTVLASADAYQWLDCSDGFAEISGESNASFKPFQNGNYAVKISQNGCSAVSTCFQIIILNANGDERSPFKVYPNPGADNIFVDLPVDGSVTIELLDLQGKILMFQNRTFIEADQSLNVNTAELSSGIYLVRITSNDEIWIARQIIMR